MGKGKGKGKGGGARKQTKKDTKNPKFRDFTEEDMDDEIDAFHKQRDIVPLDPCEDTDSSDEDNVQSMFDLPIEGSDDDEDDEDEEDDDNHDKYTAKIRKQQQIMRRKTGGVEDDMHDDDEEEQPKHVWQGKYSYGGDNTDFEIQESDEELLAKEGAEVSRMSKENAKLYSNEDFGLEDSDEEESASDREKTLEDVLPKTRGRSKPREDKGAEDDASTAYEIKKDLNALSREEQMDVVYSSAPELVGLLSELRDALDQLENKVNPLISKVKERKDCSKEGIEYLEKKQLLLLAYCQAISFYLLLKSEGHPVRDHPVIARLVKIKMLLDTMKELDNKLPSELEEILKQDPRTETQAKLIQSSVTLTSEHVSRDNGHSSASVKTSKEALGGSLANGKKQENRKRQTCETTELMKDAYPDENGNKQEHQQRQVGLQSMEMLKVRASLEEKLKKKGVFSSVANKLDRSRKFPSQPVNSQLETIDDFGDEVIDKEAGNASSVNSSKLSKLVATKLMSKSKVVSGDDDLPKRDDIGERRRKHELRVLANAGVESDDEIRDEPKALKRVGVKSVDPDVEEDDETEDSDNPLYEKVKRQRIAKLSAKAEQYSRTPAASLAEPDVVDGKRQINRQIEKNRGLTRARNKKLKNPRKKYRTKHEDKTKRRRGQVRDIKKPSGPYGGETSGINAGISRSVRF